jgi:hypothetical protein
MGAALTVFEAAAASSGTIAIRLGLGHRALRARSHALDALDRISLLVAIVLFCLALWLDDSRRLKADRAVPVGGRC